MGNVGHCVRLVSRRHIELKLVYLVNAKHPNHRCYHAPKPLQAYGLDSVANFADECERRHQRYAMPNPFVTGRKPKTRAWWWMPRFADGVTLDKDERRLIEDAVLPILAHQSIAVWVWHLPKPTAHRTKGPDFNVVVSAVSGRGVILYPTRHSQHSLWGHLADVLNGAVAQLNVRRKEKGNPEVIRTMAQARAEKRERNGRLMLSEQLAQFPECLPDDAALLVVLGKLGYEAEPAKRGKSHWIRRIYRPVLAPPPGRRPGAFKGRGYLLRLEELREEVAQVISARKTKSNPVVQETKVKRAPIPTPAPPRLPPPQKENKVPKTVLKAVVEPPKEKTLTEDEALLLLTTRFQPGNQSFTSMDGAKQLVLKLGYVWKRDDEKLDKLYLEMEGAQVTLPLGKTLLLMQWGLIRHELWTDRRAKSFPPLSLDDFKQKYKQGESAQINLMKPFSEKWRRLWTMAKEPKFKDIWYQALQESSRANPPPSSLERTRRVMKSLQTNGIPFADCENLAFAHIHADTSVIYFLRRELKVAFQAPSLPKGPSSPKAPSLPKAQPPTPKVQPKPAPVPELPTEKQNEEKTLGVGRETKSKEADIPPAKGIMDQDRAWEFLTSKLQANQKPFTSEEEAKACVTSLGHRWISADTQANRLELEIGGVNALLPLEKTLWLMQCRMLRKRLYRDTPENPDIRLVFNDLDPGTKSDSLNEYKQIKNLTPLSLKWSRLWETIDDSGKRQIWREALEATAQPGLSSCQRAQRLILALRRGGFNASDSLDLVLAHVDGQTSFLSAIYPKLASAAQRPIPPQSKPAIDGGLAKPTPKPPPSTGSKTKAPSGSPPAPPEKRPERDISEDAIHQQESDQPKPPVEEELGEDVTQGPPKRERPKVSNERAWALLTRFKDTDQPFDNFPEAEKLINSLGCRWIRGDGRTDQLHLEIEGQRVALPLNQTIWIMQTALIRHRLSLDARSATFPSPNLDLMDDQFPRRPKKEREAIVQPAALSTRWRALWRSLASQKIKDIWYQALQDNPIGQKPTVASVAALTQTLQRLGMNSEESIRLVLAHIHTRTSLARNLASELAHVCEAPDQAKRPEDEAPGRQPPNQADGPPRSPEDPGHPPIVR